MKLLKAKEKEPDIFDRLADEDIFTQVKLAPEDQLLFNKEFQKAVDFVVEKAVEKAVKEAVKEAVADIEIPEPKPSPPQIIKEVRVEVPKKDDRDLVEQSELDKALKRIKELEEKLEETDRVARSPMPVFGGAGVIGIPPPEAATVAQVLTVDANKKAVWKDATGGSGEVAPTLEGFTVTNGTERLTFDADDTSLDELADVVATIIDQLQA